MGHVLVLLSPMVDALVVVEAVQRAEYFVTQIADGVVQRLEVLLLFVPLQGQFGAEQFAAHVTTVTGSQREGQLESIAGASPSVAASAR